MKKWQTMRAKRRASERYGSFGRAIIELAVVTDIGLSQETILREAARHGIVVVTDDSHPTKEGSS